jgi:hypothetical protein
MMMMSIMPEARESGMEDEAKARTISAQAEDQRE